MSELQYRSLVNLYHNYNDAFITLSGRIQDEFYNLLIARKGFIPSPTPNPGKEALSRTKSHHLPSTTPSNVRKALRKNIT